MTRVLLMLALAVSASGLREVNFKHCKKSEPGTMKNCKVQSVEIEGCLDPTSWVDVDGAVIDYQNPQDPKSPCRLKAGSEMNFTISYEPGFSSDSLRSQFTIPLLEDCWEASNTKCPLPNTASIGCEHTKCPLRPGQERIFQATLKLSNTVPERPANSMKVYQMRWKLWDNKNKNKNCCFTFPVQY